MNLYDLIEFPDRISRDNIRAKYPAFSCFNKIPTNMLERYNHFVPIEFENYEMVVMTWINEYNHLIFIMQIPLYQAIQTFEKMFETDCSNELEQNLLFLFYYYSEITSYHINSTFEKSANIFNAMFELRINERQNSLMKIYKEIAKESDKDIFFNEVKNMFELIKNNKNYCKLVEIRNRNTHSIKVSHENLFDIYNPKTKITTTFVSKVVTPKETLTTILGAIELLGEYTIFIEKTIEKYYAFIYEEFCKNI